MSNFVGTKYINKASTKKKCDVLRKTNPELADFAEALFLGNSTSGSINEQLSRLDSNSKNIILTIFSSEIIAENETANTVDREGPGISAIKDEALSDIAGLKDTLNKALQPVSSWTGQSLGNLTNLLRDPLGSEFSVPNPLLAVIDKVNPEFADRLDASIKKFKIDELQNLPSQVMGGLRSLASTVDQALSVPFAYAADLYQGLLELMAEISDLANSLMAAVFDFIFGPKGVLDSILPMTQIMEFLEVVGELTSFVGGITSSFGGFDAVNGAISQFQSYSTQFAGVLSNPQQLLQSYIPPEASQFAGQIRNPQQLINNLIPPEISQQLGQISQIPGLGFTGNLGFSVENILAAGKEGIVSRVFSQFEGQLGILNPLFNKQGETPLTNPNQSYPPTVQPGVGGRPTVQGVPVTLQPPPPIIPQIKPQTPQDNSQRFQFGATTVRNAFPGGIR